MDTGMRYQLDLLGKGYYRWAQIFVITSTLLATAMVVSELLGPTPEEILYTILAAIPVFLGVWFFLWFGIKYALH